MLQVDSAVVAEDDPVAPKSPSEAGETTAMADIPTGADTGASPYTQMLSCVSCKQCVASNKAPAVMLRRHYACVSTC